MTEFIRCHAVLLLLNTKYYTHTVVCIRRVTDKSLGGVGLDCKTVCTFRTVTNLNLLTFCFQDDEGKFFMSSLKQGCGSGSALFLEAGFGSVLD
jgi:hypothetical protein